MSLWWLGLDLKGKWLNKLVNPCTMKEYHNIGQLNVIISENTVQCASKTKCTVIFLTMWTFQKYMKSHGTDHIAHRQVLGNFVTSGHASGECTQLEDAWAGPPPFELLFEETNYEKQTTNKENSDVPNKYLILLT